MSLRATAEADLKRITEDDKTGFGWPLKLTDPKGFVGNITGLQNDISQSIDPNTGVLVSGRFATIGVAFDSLSEAGLGLPVGVEDATKKPWIVEWIDVNCNAYKFKVKSTDPDRSLGIIICTLEIYES